jgi:hypothetical protein
MLEMENHGEQRVRGQRTCTLVQDPGAKRAPPDTATPNRHHRLRQRRSRYSVRTQVDYTGFHRLEQGFAGYRSHGTVWLATPRNVAELVPARISAHLQQGEQIHPLSLPGCFSSFR